jgi:alkanesulfonate monooxygenase SsuD/methylene tetrahydromethanopterin reductase-like flavin-dependent oxidoreductase (luciferase family)
LLSDTQPSLRSGTQLSLRSGTQLSLRSGTQPGGTVASVRVGVTLPQFSHEAEPAIAAARRAEAAGVDGVFVFDHLWPLGRPDRPALHSSTLLGALTAQTERVVLGTLVARVGLVPDVVLVHTLVTLDRMAGGRFIAGLGTGDNANRPENEAYGIAYPPAADRVASVIACARMLRDAGVRTWIGGLSAAVRRAAAEADGWNVWGVSVDRLAELGRQPARAGLELTWGGQVLVARTADEIAAKRERFGELPGVVTGTVEDLAAHLRALADAGASWAVCAPIDVGADPSTIDLVAEAAASCTLA